MRKILFILLPALLALGSCQSEPAVQPGADEKEVDIEVKSPQILTRGATDSEARVDRLDILVFQGTGDNAKFLYRRYGWQRTGTTTGYRTTLRMGSDLTLFFAANAKEILDSAPSHIFDESNGTTWSEVMEALVMDSPQNLSHAGGLPMWGHLAVPKIEDKAVNDLGTVHLLRSVASADFSLKGEALTGFNLEEVHIVYGADKGYLPYHSTQITGSGATIKAVSPYSPGSMATSADWKYTVGPGETAVNNYFYIYDNDAALPSGSGTKKQTKLVMKGVWNGAGGSGSSTYYPIAFREENSQGKLERMKVTRNFKYDIVVTAVNGDGFSTLAQAKDGEEINLEYSVIPWHIIQDNEIIVSGNEYVSLESKRANLFRSTWVNANIGMSSSYDLSDFTLDTDPDFTGPEGVLSLVLKDESYDLVDFCDVKLEYATGRFTFNFKPKLSFNDLDQSLYRQGRFYVKAGRIEFEMMVRQHNMSETDWKDGGTIVWP